MDATESQTAAQVAERDGVTIRLFTPADYALLTGWWAHYGWPAPHLSWLPETMSIVEWDGHPVCAGCVYLEMTKRIALITWIVGDPNAGSERRAICVDRLVDELVGLARAAGWSLAYTNSANPGMQARYRRMGWLDGGAAGEAFLLPLNVEEP